MDSSIKNLTWSLRPLLLFTNCIGIHLPDCAAHSSTIKRNQRWIKFSHTLFCFLLNVVSQVGSFVFLLRSKSTFGVIGQDNLDTTTAFVNAICDYANYAIASVGSHLILLVVVRPRWVEVISSFQCYEKQLKREFYIKLRRVSLLGVCLTAFLVK
jgi:hypothetical protein